jgi:glycosyltransferase involved in cell wall biosynthesis
MKVHILPRFRGVDAGEGGIRRIVEAQHRWLPEMGIEVVDDLAEADLVATHAGSTGNIPVQMPWVVHTHGLYWKEYRWPKWCHDLNRQVVDAMRRADHVTAPSEWVAQALRRGMWLRPTVLEHGIDMDDWEPTAQPGKYTLWNKNRPDPVCDPKPLIAVAALAPDLGFVTTFGQPADNVRVTDKVGYAAMRELVRNAGVYLATTRETFGIGTLEAMAAAVPVVGWAWGGQRDIIDHGETGWLVPPGDHEGLVEGIRWALANRAAVGANAREAVRARWTWEQRMPPYVDLYQELYEAKAEAFHAGPAVSVIVPCYNLAKYLPQAIRSLQAQTMTDWEAVIVNDASPDDTAQVAASLAAEDRRVRVVTNPENLYLAGALNAGIGASHGRYILPLDADNMVEPWTLGVLAGALDADRGIHIAYGACKFVNEDGSPDTSVAPDGISGWPRGFSFKGQMLHRNQIPSTCMMRRVVWERSGGYRRRCRTAEDAEHWTRVTSLGFVADKVTTRTTLIYRQMEGSMSRQEADWDWTAWFPWARRMDLVPFGVHEAPPAKINGGIAWPVASYEPVKVAVIIPVGPGHEELLIDALDSLEAQTLRNWECIVANDTGAPLRIPHSWAKVIDVGPGAGPARARNLAIAVSTAPVFVPLDADDFLQPRALQAMLEAYRAVGGVVYSQWYDDKGGTQDLYDPPEYDAKLLVEKGAIHAVTALYPRKAWAQVGGFDEELSHWEDWDFQLQMAAIGVCGTKLQEPLFTYRKTTGTRREENMRAFEQGKGAILSKWSPVWDGRETLMACRGCGGGGGARMAPPPAVGAAAQRNAAALKPRDGYVVLRYTGRSAGTRVYRGKVSGTNYRFGSDAAHRLKYVLEADLEGLLPLRDGGLPLFERVATTSGPLVEHQGGPPLAAPGPPPREDQTISAHAPQDGNGAAYLTLKELRRVVAKWTVEEAAQALAKERQSEAPRVGAVTLLEKRIQEG